MDSNLRLDSTFILLSLFFACVHSESWSIDCGSATGLKEKATGITWVGDGGYVHSGTTFTVPQADGTPFATLRAFPKNRKNCYTVPVGIARKVLVTANFYYGNYDGLKSPPTFQFIIDGGSWIEVNTGDRVFVHKIIYVTRRNDTSICVGRLHPNQTPFISAIDVRVLEANMYNQINSSFALEPLRTVAFGADSAIGFPDDPYNRLWSPPFGLTEGFNYSFLSSNGFAVNTSKASDNPPAVLFRRAATPIFGNDLSIRMAYLPPDYKFAVYLSMYFSEVDEAARRSFQVYMDDTPLTKSPIVPPFGEVLQISGVVAGVTGNTLLKLVPTNEPSGMPPIISAMEVLLPSLTTDGTNAIDVDVLEKLKMDFKVLQQWSGDPCLPSNYSWEWVTCSKSIPPRVTALWLGSYGLEGEIPDFSRLDALETIDLHNNSLSGSIPDFLGEFPKLKELNLALNNFTSIPPTILGNKNIAFNTTGNPVSSSPSGSTPTPPSPTSTSGSQVRQRVSGTWFLQLLFVFVTVG